MEFLKSLLPSRRGKADADQLKTDVVIPSVVQPEIDQSAHSNKRLLDLNDLCLEKIFWYLNYDELLNVVHYDKHFEATAKKVFFRKYLNEYVVLSNVSSFRPMHSSSEIDRSIQLLDCFGDVITNLCICFKLENIGSLIYAVNRRCGNNIRKLKLNHANQERQKSVHHEHGTLSVNKLLKCINKTFPHLDELHLIYGSTSDECPYWYDVDEMFIPSLINFTLDGRFVFETFKKFIGINPSIENLCVKTPYSDFKWNIEYDFVPLLDNALPKLKYLEMSIACHVHVPDQQSGHCHPVYLQHLKKFKSVGCTTDMWMPNFYQFAGNALEELELSELYFGRRSFIANISYFKQLRQITVEVMGRFYEAKKTRWENDVNTAFMNVEPIKVVVVPKELTRSPALDLHLQRINSLGSMTFSVRMVNNRK